MQLNFFDPQSRLMAKLLGRNFDNFTTEAQRNFNLLALVIDIVAIILLINLLF